MESGILYLTEKCHLKNSLKKSIVSDILIVFLFF